MAQTSTSTSSSRIAMLPQRRLSISSNSQWTAQGRSAPLSSSGYALSPSSSTTSFDALRQSSTLPPSSSSPSSSSSLHRSPSIGSARQKTIRQLDPVSIFERLGLGNANGVQHPATQLTSQQHNHHQHHPGPSPGREDAHLPSEEFEGIPDTSDMNTPMPSSLVSEHESNHGSSRRTLSSGLMHPTSHLALQEQRSSTITTTGDAADPSSTASTPTSNALLEIASAPPVDLADPSIHPRHAIVLDYPATAEGEQANESTSSASNGSGNNNSKIIPVNEDILLPFVERPKEVRELLEEEPRNASLYERLKEVFAVHPHPPLSSSTSSSSTTPSLKSSTTSSTSTTLQHSLSSSSSSEHSNNHGNKHTWEEVESILYKPREELKDQEWIDSLKILIFPRSTALWERLRACLGIDVDDEQGGDKFEELSSDFSIPGSSAGFPSFAGGSLSGSGFLHSPLLQQVQGMYSATTPGVNTPPTGGQDVFSSSSLASPSKNPPSSLGEDMLSPRAILRTHGGIANGGQAGGINIPGMSPASAAKMSFYSPAGSAGVSPSPSPGPGVPSSLSSSSAAAAAARQFDRTAATSTAGGVDMTGSRSPGKSGQGSNLQNQANPVSATGGAGGSGGGGDSARMHRRTSSGGSGFRRSFAMSSISEDAQVNDFGPSSLSGRSTPSMEIAQTQNQNQDPYNSSNTSTTSSLSSSFGSENTDASMAQSSFSGVDLGNLLRLKGAHVGASGTGLPPTSATPASASKDNTPSASPSRGSASIGGINIVPPPQYHQYHSALQGSALSTSSASSFAPSSGGGGGGMSGHSMMHGQAPLLSPHIGAGNNINTNAASSMLGLNVDPLPSGGISNSPQLSRSPSFGSSSAARIGASGGLGGNYLPPPPASPSFNAIYNKRAYDEYNPVFESDDGSSVAGSVRSTGRGPGMRRSFGSIDAMSPVRGPAPLQRAGGGFALAGVNIGKKQGS